MIVLECGNSGEEEVLGGEIIISETVLGVVGGESEAVFGTGAAKDDALQAGATKESIFSDVGDLWQVDTCQGGAIPESIFSDVGGL